MIIDKTVAIYVRVSTKKQSCGMQISELKKFAKESKFKVYEIYQDHGYSGAFLERPGLDNLRKDAKELKFDAILLYSHDRLSRDTKQGEFLDVEFKNNGIKTIRLPSEADDCFDRNFKSCIEKYNKDITKKIYKEIYKDVYIEAYANARKRIYKEAYADARKELLKEQHGNYTVNV